jgi:hypothetical protein
VNARTPPNTLFTLLQRELREYRGSLLWTPVIIAALLVVLLGASVFFADRISVFGEAFMQVLQHEGGDGSLNISISVGDDEVTVYRRGELDERLGPPLDLPISAPEAPPPPEAWNFSRDWTFSPLRAASEETAPVPEEVGGLNPVLNVLHNLLLLVLMFTTANYLLGALFDDRKDRSILFWRSMPVSEWQTVLSKFLVVAVVAPGVVFIISFVLQVLTLALSAVLAWRMEVPTEKLFAGLALGRLALDQFGGWVLTALWLAPIWAWLLLASAAARRSPFLLAVTPVIALAIAEALLFGSHHVIGAVVDHLPKLVADVEADPGSAGLYLFGPNWHAVNLPSMGAGLVAAGLLLAGAVWLRRHRWEI